MYGPANSIGKNTQSATPSSPTQVSNALNTQGEYIAALEETVSLLEKRLDTVVRHEPEASDKTDGRIKQVQVPLANAIDERTARIDAQTRRLAYLISHLEV